MLNISPILSCMLLVSSPKTALLSMESLNFSEVMISSSSLPKNLRPSALSCS